MMVGSLHQRVAALASDDVLSRFDMFHHPVGRAEGARSGRRLLLV